jgi:hypothetical protein
VVAVSLKNTQAKGMQAKVLIWLVIQQQDVEGQEKKRDR